MALIFSTLLILYTISGILTVTKATALINQRPLGDMGNDCMPLTMADFLYSGVHNLTLYECQDWMELSLSSRRDMLWHDVKSTWEKFQTGYITLLQKRGKGIVGESLAIDEFVIIQDLSKNAGRFVWRQICKTFKGKDGVVRSCNILLPNGKIYQRNYKQLAVIPRIPWGSNGGVYIHT